MAPTRNRGGSETNVAAILKDAHKQIQAQIEKNLKQVRTRLDRTAKSSDLERLTRRLEELGRRVEQLAAEPQPPTGRPKRRRDPVRAALRNAQKRPGELMEPGDAEDIAEARRQHGEGSSRPWAEVKRDLRAARTPQQRRQPASRAASTSGRK